MLYSACFFFKKSLASFSSFFLPSFLIHGRKIGQSCIMSCNVSCYVASCLSHTCYTTSLTNTISTCPSRVRTTRYNNLLRTYPLTCGTTSRSHPQSHTCDASIEYDPIHTNTHGMSPHYTMCQSLLTKNAQRQGDARPERNVFK